MIPKIRVTEGKNVPGAVPAGGPEIPNGSKIFFEHLVSHD